MIMHPLVWIIDQKAVIQYKFIIIEAITNDWNAGLPEDSPLVIIIYVCAHPKYKAENKKHKKHETMKLPFLPSSQRSGALINTLSVASELNK